MYLADQETVFKVRASRWAVVIPVLDEGERILTQLRRLESIGGADLILVDGGSQDGSTQPRRLSELGVRVLLLVKQRGLGRALQAGTALAMRDGYDGVITVDGNGKDGVEALPQFIDRLEAGYDLVQGSRFMAGGLAVNTPWARKLGIQWLISPLLSLSAGFRYTDPTNGFKGLSRRLLEDCRLQPFREELSEFNWQFYVNARAPQLGMRIIEIPVSRVYPSTGEIPTKIRGVRAHSKLLWQLLVAAGRGYDPP